jgi:hypothetical protein
MFNSKYFIAAASDIPAAWIFENYLGLPPLHGQTVRIPNPNSTTGRDSLAIYYNADSGEYRYKCFSSGKGGSAIDYLMQEWDRPFMQVFEQVKKDYLEFLKNGFSADRKILTDGMKWELQDYVLRNWRVTDGGYWSPYNIGSPRLERFNVRPLESFTMVKKATEFSQEQMFTISHSHLYGYFTADGELYKVYQPMREQGAKFIKVKGHLQGEDQLQGHPYLLEGSSLKDIMVVDSMGLRLDVIAPDSENTLIPLTKLESLIQKHRYKAVVSLFDNDQAGITSMRRLREEQGIPYCYLPLAKDVADASKIHGIGPTMVKLIPSLHRALDLFGEIGGPIQQLVNKYTL